MSQSRKASTTTSDSDDLIIPFQTDTAPASGRLVRLGPVVDEILANHGYPEPVSKLLGEAVTLTALLGAALKFDGTFILQTSTDGPVSMLVADYTAPGKLRGHATYDREAVETLIAADKALPATLLGNGHMAMTIDQGTDMERYQGIVPLDHCDLNAAADTYFRRSVQLDTFLQVAVARHFTAASNGSDSGWHWRAGGLMVQNLTREGGQMGIHADPDFLLGDDSKEDWNRVRILAATVQDQELVDPMLSPERLLYRLFHEESVRAFSANPLEFECRCSREKVQEMLSRFGPEDLEDMVEDGEIRVTCEFCNQLYRFEAAEYV